MTHQAPIESGQPLDLAPDPNPDQPRTHHDRWTAPKMAAFLRQLSATHSVSAAARSVGMSRQSAYRLRSRLKGGAFDLAWDVAFHHSYDNLAHAALERALNGVEIPIFHKGEQVGSYRKYDERLTLALLAQSTQRGNVPLLGRHAPAAERHAGRFEALVAEVEAGAAGDGGVDAPVVDPGPAAHGEVDRIYSASASPLSDADLMAELHGLWEGDAE
jgi:hypothetical protein